MQVMRRVVLKKRVKNFYVGSKLSNVLQKLANTLKNRHHLFITVRALGTFVVN